eukprot:654887-Prymnesium_polylepis.1
MSDARRSTSAGAHKHGWRGRRLAQGERSHTAPDVARGLAPERRAVDLCSPRPHADLVGCAHRARGDSRVLRSGSLLQF